MTGAEYPGAIWMPADKSNYRSGRIAPISWIVLHATDGRGDPKATAAMWQQPKHGSSAHIVIGQDGSIVQAVHISDTAWACHAANARSINIEHCARTPREWDKSDPGLLPTEVQLANSAKLIAWLCTRYKLPRDTSTIKSHVQADPQTTHTDCCEGAGIIIADMIARVVAVP